MHRPYRDILNLKFSCPYLFPFSHKVVPQKASGEGRRGGGGGRGGGVVYHTSTGQYIGVATFFFLNLGYNWTKNRLRMVSKVRNVRLGVFSGGGCHHPNHLRPDFNLSNLKSMQITILSKQVSFTELCKIGIVSKVRLKKLHQKISLKKNWLSTSRKKLLDA